jgi:hypothetical protein
VGCRLAIKQAEKKTRERLLDNPLKVNIYSTSGLDCYGQVNF